MRKLPMWWKTSPQPISIYATSRMSYSSTPSSASVSSHFGSASMPLVENGQIVQDRYTYVGDEEPIPERVPVIVPAQRFLAEADALIRRDGSLAVSSPNAPPIGHLSALL